MKNYSMVLLCLLNLNTIVLYDFEKGEDLGQWYVVNDGVMGGLSQGYIAITEEGHAIFSGNVSLENYGGFTSIRHTFPTKNIVGYKTVFLRIKGDGKRYQFRIKSKSQDWYSYISYFETSGEWETIAIPIDDLYPVYRGRELNMPNFPAKEASEISILIANKKAEDFELILDKITLE